MTHGPEQYGEVGLGRRQQTTGEEDFPGEAIPEDPQHLMADVRLEAIESQDDPALGLGDPLQAGGVSQREGEQFVVPFEQMAHCPWGDDHTALAQVLIDFGHTAMLCVTQGTGIHVRRDNWVSVRYAEELNSATSSGTQQRTDRHGILDQKPPDFQLLL